MSFQRQFAGVPESVAAARAFVRDVVELPDETLQSVMIMVSELATNAVVHAHGAFVVSVECTDDIMRVEVSDQGTGAPTLRSPDADDPHGRGLQVVAGLSDDWGVVPDSPSSPTRVWFSVGLPATKGSGPGRGANR
jgi:anti-sigma regulatory factor (Ser/Thr protein kinase)